MQKYGGLHFPTWCVDDAVGCVYAPDPSSRLFRLVHQLIVEIVPAHNHEATEANMSEIQHAVRDFKIPYPKSL